MQHNSNVHDELETLKWSRRSELFFNVKLLFYINNLRNNSSRDVKILKIHKIEYGSYTKGTSFAQ
jgi:hypothetical protein